MQLRNQTETASARYGLSTGICVASWLRTRLDVPDRLDNQLWFVKVDEVPAVRCASVLTFGRVSGKVLLHRSPNLVPFCELFLSQLPSPRERLSTR